ncbi:exported hypothetical protein [Pseudomonas sp. OF001]|nr:exported hypothetical protein [Pseudomonas sp. OF001]
MLAISTWASRASGYSASGAIIWSSSSWRNTAAAGAAAGAALAASVAAWAAPGCGQPPRASQASRMALKRRSIRMEPLLEQAGGPASIGRAPAACPLARPGAGRAGKRRTPRDWPLFRRRYLNPQDHTVFTPARGLA